MDALRAGRNLEITLLQERSAGTFARVYLAEAQSQDGLARIVAVKVLKEQWSESAELLDRTRDEAQLLGRLHHRNILRVEAMAELQGQPAIVMEFVDGVDCKQIIERQNRLGLRLSPGAALKIAQDAASALEAAYFKVPYGRSDPLQVVHRDVKPSNIMVSIHGEVKVLDFGTARFDHEARLARTGALRFGSLKYMSPERRIGDRGDHPSDIYALGLVLIEMLQGELLPLLPLDRNEHDEVIADTIARLDQLGLPNEQWIASLRQTLGRMCASDPAMRLHAGQVAELMRAFVEQAAGASLDRFAAETVTEITREIYGDGSDGALSGSRIFVSMEGGQEVAAANEESAEAAQPVSLVPDPSASNVQDLGPPLPSQARMLSVPDEFDPVTQQGEPATVRMSDRVQPAPGARPTPAVSAQHDAYSVGPAHHGGGDPIWQAAPEPAPESSMGLSLVIAVLSFAVVLALLATLVAGGGLAYWWASQPVAQGPVDTPVEGSPGSDSPPPEEGATAAPMHAVAIRAEHDTLQWVKLLDAEGTQLLKASPNGAAEVPAGDYTLQAKVIGRGKVSATVALEGPMDFSCSPGREPAIRCTDATSGRKLDLRP